MMRDPIYYTEITGQIKTFKTKKVITFKVRNIIAKGSIDQIKKCNRVKKRFLLNYLGSNKKVQGFDLRRLKIIKVEIIMSLGHGIKRE